jgi:hypothetical protein
MTPTNGIGRAALPYSYSFTVRKRGYMDENKFKSTASKNIKLIYDSYQLNLPPENVTPHLKDTNKIKRSSEVILNDDLTHTYSGTRFGRRFRLRFAVMTIFFMTRYQHVDNESGEVLQLLN